MWTESWNINLARNISLWSLFSLALLICRLGLSHSLSLLLSLSFFPDSARFEWDDASLRYPEIGSCRFDCGYGPFSLGIELSDRLSNGLPVSLLCSLLSLVQFLLHHFSFVVLDPTGIRILPASDPWKEILYVTHAYDYQEIFNYFLHAMFILDIRWSFVLHYLAPVCLLDILIILVLLCFLYKS